MSELEPSGMVTQITTVSVDPTNEAEAIAVMKERARFMATQPGFVSIRLHCSPDRSHIVNYIQWASRAQLEAAHRTPEFRKPWPRFGALVKEVQPAIYDVVMVEQR